MSQTVSLEQTNLLETFIRAKLGQLAPQLHTWFTPEQLRQNLKVELEQDLEWTHNLEWAEQFHGNFGIGQPEDYRVRTLELPSLGTVWTHIRFRGGDKARPFVDLRSSLNLLSSSGPPREVRRGPRGAVLAKTPFRPRRRSWAKTAQILEICSSGCELSTPLFNPNTCACFCRI